MLLSSTGIHHHARAVGDDVLRALEYAHTSGVVHETVAADPGQVTDSIAPHVTVTSLINGVMVRGGRLPGYSFSTQMRG